MHVGACRDLHTPARAHIPVHKRTCMLTSMHICAFTYAYTCIMRMYTRMYEYKWNRAMFDERMSEGLIEVSHII